MFFVCMCVCICVHVCMYVWCVCVCVCVCGVCVWCVCGVCVSMKREHPGDNNHQETWWRARQCQQQGPDDRQVF